MTAYALPVVVPVPSQALYPAGGNPWNGTSPTSLGTMTAGFVSYGWTM